MEKSKLYEEIHAAVKSAVGDIITGVAQKQSRQKAVGATKRSRKPGGAPLELAARCDVAPCVTSRAVLTLVK